MKILIFFKKSAYMEAEIQNASLIISRIYRDINHFLLLQQTLQSKTVHLERFSVE